LIETVRHSLEEHIKYLIEEIKQTELMIREHIGNHPDLKVQSNLLGSIPGIGATTAARLLAEITDFKQYQSARQVAAYAGLVPRERRSGSSVRGRTWFIEDRQRPSAKGTLFSGDDGSAVQRLFSAVGSGNA